MSSVPLTNIDIKPTSGNLILATSSTQWSSVPMTGQVAITNTGLTSLVSASAYNFSAFISSVTVSSSAQLTTFSTTTPFYSGTGFNATTGSFTAPATGKYVMLATMNYAIASPLTLSLGSTINPYFAIQKTSPSSSTLLTGSLPIINITLIRCLLGSGQVNLSGIVQLTAGDVVGLFYQASGGTTSVPLGAGSSPGVVWSVYSLF